MDFIYLALMEWLYAWQKMPIGFIATIGFIFGAIVGSFLNVVIYRFPVILERTYKAYAREELGLEPVAFPVFNLSTPRSRCGNCGHAITALENIPILSYLFLRGKCHGCGQHISIQYPLVELFTALASAFICWKFGAIAATPFYLLFTWCLIASAGIDLRCQLLPDDITLPLMWLGIVLAMYNILPISLLSSIKGAILGYLSLWSFYWAFKLIRKKEGMGYGDFKLLAALGAWLGVHGLLPIILLSSLVGSVIGITLVLCCRQDKQIPIAFGPYLAIAGWIFLISGKELTLWFNRMVDQLLWM